MECDILILANSYMHNGRCIAGKDINTGEWIRLKNPFLNGQTSNGSFGPEELISLYGSYDGPKPLEILKISLSNRCPLHHQPENCYISWEPWEKMGKLDVSELYRYLDMPSEYDNFRRIHHFEWIGDTVTSQNKIPKSGIGGHIKKSLILINVTFMNNGSKIKYEPNAYGVCKPRLEFTYDGINYNLPVTDPLWGNKTIKVDTWLEKAYVTLGLGELYRNSYYKLAVNVSPYL